MSSWPAVALGEVTEQVRDSVTVVHGVAYPLLGVRWYGQGPFLRETVTAETSKAKTLYRVTPRQFIYNRLFAGKGSFGLVPSELAGSFVSNEFPLFDCDVERLLPEYLAHYFRQPRLWGDVERLSSGTTASRNRWNEPSFRAHEIPLPPLHVQRRVVDLLDTVDAHILSLQREETATEQLLSALRTRLLTPTDDWRSHPLGELAEVRLGRMLSKERSTGPDLAPYVRNANVQWGGLDLSDLKKMSFPERERATYALLAGDILVCEGGDPGRAVLLREDLPGVYYQKAIHRVRSTQMDPAFLYHWLAECYATSAIADLCTNTTIKHLTAEKFRTLRVAVPPIAHQAHIASVLDAVLATLASLRTEITAMGEVRVVLLALLLSGEVEIPRTYDALFAGVA